MSRSLYENHWGSPTLTLLNVLGVLGVINVLNVPNVLHVLHVLYVLHVLNMPMDASLACWALFSRNSRLKEMLDERTLPAMARWLSLPYPSLPSPSLP